MGGGSFTTEFMLAVLLGRQDIVVGPWLHLKLAKDRNNALGRVTLAI